MNDGEVHNLDLTSLMEVIGVVEIPLKKYGQGRRVTFNNIPVRYRREYLHTSLRMGLEEKAIPIQ